MILNHIELLKDSYSLVIICLRLWKSLAFFGDYFLLGFLCIYDYENDDEYEYEYGKLALDSP